MISQDDMEFMSISDLDATPDEDLPVEDALAYLLLDCVCFVNCRHHSMVQNGQSDGLTTVIFVVTNDVFAFGCADAEDFPSSEIVPLYRLWRQDSTWGPVRWACRRRQRQPQQALIDAMKESGAWDAEMASLPENPFNQPCQSTI